MDSKPKYKFSMISVTIIFLLIYLGEIAIGSGLFFKFFIPFVESYKEARLGSQLSKNVISTQASVYALLKQNKLDEASRSAQMMLSQSKNQNDKALSLMVIGEVFAAQNENVKARSYFSEALTLDPKLPGAYMGLASIDLIDKNFKSAITNSQKAINLLPERTDFNFILGLAYFGSGDKNKAISAIQKAVNGNPEVELYKRTLDEIKNGSLNSISQSQSVNTTQVSGPGYIKQDIDNLVTDLNNADSDFKNIQGFKGSSTYNQKTIERIIELIPMRKALAQKLLDKMGKGQVLTQADFSIWDQYDALSLEQNNLVKTLYNSNGGF